MQQKNLHTEKLYPYLFYAPLKYQRKFYNFHGAETLNRFYNRSGNSCFMGMLFYDNRVFCYNVEIYNEDEGKSDRYLEITGLFNKLLKDYNIFHLCFLMHRAIYKYYRENALTENILPFIRYQNDSRYKPKFTYAVTKHRGRHRLFIENYPDENKREWNRILLSAIREDRFSEQLRKYKNERPNLFTGIYQALPKVNCATYEYDSTKGLRKSIKARRRRIGGDLSSRRFLRRSNSNNKLKR